MHIRALEGDPIIDDVVRFLREHGRVPHWRRFPSALYQHPTDFQVEGERIFEPEDLKTAEYFHMSLNVLIADGGRHLTGGKLRVERAEIKRKPFGRVLVSSTAACTESFRRELENEALVGLTFRPIQIGGRKPPIESLWQLWSDRSMTPLLNRVINYDGTDYDALKRGGCYVDDFFWPPLLQFSEKTIREQEPFDTALTYECFGPPPAQYEEGDGLRLLEPWLIVSRRFRHWCETKKLKIDWWPIILS